MIYIYISYMVNLSSSCLYVRITTGKGMYCLGGTLFSHMSIFQNPKRKWNIFPRWSTCLPAVYMSESQQEMICISKMVHLSSTCVYVRILTGNHMYYLDFNLPFIFIDFRILTGNDMHFLDDTLVWQRSICQNHNRE